MLALVGGVVTAGVTYYFTPKYTRVGYEPVQPVPFSHAIHAGQLGMDCRYCHNTRGQIMVLQHPGASTCMNCHSQVLKDDPRLASSAKARRPTTRRFRGCKSTTCRITFISTTRSTSRAASVAWNATGALTRWTRSVTPNRSA